MKQQSQQVSEYFCPICRAQAHEVWRRELFLDRYPNGPEMLSIERDVDERKNLYFLEVYTFLFSVLFSTSPLLVFAVP